MILQQFGYYAIIKLQYRIYDDTDIKKFCDVYFAKGAQGENAQGILASKLFPAIDR